jgi:hypothetical protein
LTLDPHIKPHFVHLYRFFTALKEGRGGLSLDAQLEDAETADFEQTFQRTETLHETETLKLKLQLAELQREHAEAEVARLRNPDTIRTSPRKPTAN